MNVLETLGSQKGITLVSQNIRSLTQSQDEVRLLLEKTGVDLYLMQETFLSELDADTNHAVPGYHLYRLDRTANSGKLNGGGLAAYARDHYKIEHLPDKNQCNPDIEIQWFKLSLPNTRDTYIINTYRPPSGNVHNAIEMLESEISPIMGNRSPDVLIMGDFNIDWSKDDANKKKLRTFANNLSLSQLIRKPTRTTNTVRSTIDHIFTNNSIFYENHGVLDAGLSDHAMVYVSRKRNKFKRKTEYVWARSYRNFDANLFKHDINLAPWTKVYSYTDVNQAADAFIAAGRETGAI